MEKRIEIPEEVEVSINGRELTVSGPKGELKREFFYPKTSIEKVGNEVVASTDIERKENKAILGTWISHVRNMAKGVTEGYSTKMKVVHKHFPMSVKVSDGAITVQNLFGQKSIRNAKIPDGVDVKVSGDEIEISGIDKEQVGNTVSNIENACKNNGGRDRRRFYDGIYKVN